MTLDTHKIFECSKKDGLNTSAALLKTMEELGELSAAHINKIGLSNRSASSSPNTLEEGTDVYICILDYLFKDGHTIGDINAMVEKKTIKWIAKIERNAQLARDEDATYYKSIEIK